MRQSTQLCKGCFCNLRVPAQKHAEKYPFSHHREIQMWKFLPYQGADAKFLQRWKVGEENYSRFPKSKQTACTWKCPWAAKSWEADKSPQRCTTVLALITILRGGFPLLKTDCGPARIFSRGFPRCMLQPAANLNSTAPISWPSAVSCRCRLFPMSGSTVHQTVKTTWMHQEYTHSFHRNLCCLTRLADCSSHQRLILHKPQNPEVPRTSLCPASHQAGLCHKNA